MRIMIDTNILISALLFPNSIVAKTFEKILLKHSVVICSYTVDELHSVFERKFSNKLSSLEKFLSTFSYELVYTPKVIEPNKYVHIRDKYDLPILVSAIISDVDIILTGDKDFSGIEIEKPEILTPADFQAKYSVK